MSIANIRYGLTIIKILSVLFFCFVTSAQAQFISTVAGNGGYNNAGDGGPATCAELSIPGSVCVNSKGELFITGSGTIRKVDPVTGIISRVAGNGTGVYSGDGGPAINCGLQTPVYVTTDPADNLYILDYHRLRKINAATGIITTIAGGTAPGFSGDGGPAINARLTNPRSLCLDKQGNIYIADTYNERIRKIDAVTGIITTIAGNGGPFNSSGDGGPAINAGIPGPNGLVMDAAGNLYFTEVKYPFTSRLRRIDAATGIITTLAGNNDLIYSGDGGPAVNAGLADPTSICIDPAGNIYISELRSNRIRKIDAATKIITTIAGTGTAGYSGDGGPAINGQLDSPAGICLNAAGDLYIGDLGNNRVRKVSSKLVIPPVVTPSVSIKASATTICTGSLVTFTATPVNGGTAPVYEWKKNGTVTGTNSDIYTSSTLNDGDLITCAVTVTPCGGAEQTVNSNTVKMTVTTPAKPAISISSDVTSICNGGTVNFTATATNAGTLPFTNGR